MELSKKCLQFLSFEFGITENGIFLMDKPQLRELREKCFDIEVDEAVEADNNNTDISQRGKIASDCVDEILNFMKSKNTAIEQNLQHSLSK